VIILQLGYVMARVYTSEAEIPVRDAVFSVESDSAENTYLYGVRTTDENGKTTPVPVGAPDAQDSLSPGSSLPYTTVNVRISHPEYITKYITGVQVFAGQVSVQQASMLPLSPGLAPDKQTERIDIPRSEL